MTYQHKTRARKKPGGRTRRSDHLVPPICLPLAADVWLNGLGLAVVIGVGRVQATGSPNRTTPGRLPGHLDNSGAAERRVPTSCYVHTAQPSVCRSG
jgi:hypothetical protein